MIKKHQNGTVLSVFVTPEARNVVFPAGVNEWRKCLEIKVKSSAVDNKANKDVVKTIADFFKKSVNDVFVVSGSKKREKSVLVKGVSIDFVSQKLKESLDGL
ncbi:MAG: YggU family protein [Thermoplasmata archaeon M9B1D]|nr:MAG: YggU family protein [Thermoplasmata archaeon M9B1D]PNX50741.1 MAG: YggU family protein [Thermoplasmata archaeon M8B2D]